MAKGVSIKFKSYQETVPKLLDLIKFATELKKHNSIVLKPFLSLDSQASTPASFTEAVLKFCLAHKNPEAQVYIAEGADGADTFELFESYSYNKIAEMYGIGLVDLNTSECEEIRDDGFLKYELINYPKILLNSFVIPLPKLYEDKELEVISSLSSMVGAFPSKYYKGFFSTNKNKIRKVPFKYSIHDILCCKLPEFTIIDASAQGYILAGQPLEVDRQAAKVLGKDWRNIGFLRLLEESLATTITKKQELSENPKK